MHFKLTFVVGGSCVTAECIESSQYKVSVLIDVALDAVAACSLQLDAQECKLHWLTSPEPGPWL